MTKILVLITVLFSFGTCFAANPKIVLIEKNAGSIAPLNLEFVTTSSSGMRVLVLRGEIYGTIIVQQIKRGQTEGEDDTLVGSYRISSDDLANKLGIHSLKFPFDFIKWDSPQSFRMKTSDKVFTIKFDGSSVFTIDILK